MSGFLKKIFGGKSNGAGGPKELIQETLADLLEASQLDLDFELNETKENTYVFELFGSDEEFLRKKDGQLLDAFQLFLTRFMQHRYPEDRYTIIVDNAGFREEVNKELIGLAEKLKNVAVEKGKPVYFRALPPRDRKVIHQYLADDGRVKSRSVGEGVFKKIKIFPIKGSNNSETTTEAH